MLVMGGRPLKVLASELGVNDTALRTWRNEYLEETDRHPGGLSTQAHARGQGRPAIPGQNRYRRIQVPASGGSR